MKLSGLFRAAFSAVFPRAAARYEAALDTSARSVIFSPVQSPTRDLTPLTRRKLISKSRYFYENEALFCTLIERMTSYVIGGGLHVVPDSSSSDFNAAAAEYWREFCELPEFASDKNFLNLQSIIIRSAFMDGDVFVYKTYDEAHNPKIQIIEGYRITDGLTADIDKPEGVVLDKYGRPTCYEYHPTDDDICKPVKIPAQHLVRFSYDKRPNQYRGVPIAHAAIRTIHDIDDILALEKQAVKHNSSIVGVASKEGDDEFQTPPMRPFGEQIENVVQSNIGDAELAKYYSEQIEGSMIFTTRKNETLELKNNDRPGPAWQGFISFLVDATCLSVGLTPSIVLGQKRGGVDTRACLATAQRIVEGWQNSYIDSFQLIYEYVIEDGIIRGKIPAVPDWHKTKWRRPPKITVDAGREAQNEREDVKNGLMTLEEHYSARGKDYRREITQKAEEVRYMLDECARLSIPAEALSINLKSAVFAGGKGNTEIPQTTASLISGKQLRRPNGQFGGSDGTGKKKKSPNPKTRKKAFILKHNSISVQEAKKIIRRGEKIKAADGKKAFFGKFSLKHNKLHLPQDANARLRQINLAIKTIKHGFFRESKSSKGYPQTDFIQQFGNEFFYVARRNDSGEIYSWHPIKRNRFKKIKNGEENI